MTLIKAVERTDGDTCPTTYFSKDFTLRAARQSQKSQKSEKAFSFVLTSTEEKYKKRPMTEARLKNQLRNRGSQRRPLWFAPPCAGRFARRDRPSRAGSRCQTRNRTPKSRHALDPSSADARAPANPRRACRVHAKSRRRKRSYPRRSPRPLCPRISILVLAKRTTGTTCETESDTPGAHSSSSTAPHTPHLNQT